MSEKFTQIHEIDSIKIHLMAPTEFNMKWEGRDDLVRQMEASWLCVEKEDLPLSPRLVGPPGTGKTTLAYHTAKKLGKDVYFFQATMDTRPEDLVVQVVIESGNSLRYMASSLLSAVIKGGVCILDEGNRMSEKSWASLAPLLDHRRYVESVVAGLRIHAHPDFRFCTTMNEDASTFDLPEYIHSRLQPQIYIDFPEAEEELKIMAANLPFAPENLLQYVVDFLQNAHMQGELWSVRDGINVARYALKLSRMDNTNPLEKLPLCIANILGHQALGLTGKK
ncbi:MAG: MoxR family ATPase [Deltaproteobacteria bacterium]|nr:MoxR family ATPase [Deltaproteobacteria bacterium]